MLFRLRLRCGLLRPLHTTGLRAGLQMNNYRVGRVTTSRKKNLKVTAFNVMSGCVVVWVLLVSCYVSWSWSGRWGLIAAICRHPCWSCTSGAIHRSHCLLPVYSDDHVTFVVDWAKNRFAYFEVWSCYCTWVYVSSRTICSCQIIGVVILVWCQPGINTSAMPEMWMPVTWRENRKSPTWRNQFL